MVVCIIETETRQKKENLSQSWLYYQFIFLQHQWNRGTSIWSCLKLQVGELHLSPSLNGRRFCTLHQGHKRLSQPVGWQTAPVSLSPYILHLHSCLFFLHSPIWSTSLLKAISQSCKFTEEFPHIQTAMSQTDAAFMQIWKGPNSWCCWGRTLLVDFNSMCRLQEREHALLRIDLCSIIELSGVSLLHHMV